MKCIGFNSLSFAFWHYFSYHADFVLLMWQNLLMFGDFDSYKKTIKEFLMVICAKPVSEEPQAFFGNLLKSKIPEIPYQLS